MSLSTAINLGLVAPNFLNPGARLSFGPPPISTTVDRMTTTVDATIRTVDRS